LFSLNEVGNITQNINASGKEPGSSSKATAARDNCPEEWFAI
jgi:hypothetical protein